MEKFPLHEWPWYGWLIVPPILGLILFAFVMGSHYVATRVLQAADRTNRAIVEWLAAAAILYAFGLIFIAIAVTID